MESKTRSLEEQKLIDAKIASIKKKEELIKKRQLEIEEDKRLAEAQNAAVNLRPSIDDWLPDKTPPLRPSNRVSFGEVEELNPFQKNPFKGRGRGKRDDKQKTGGPPPDPVSFLADPERDLTSDPPNNHYPSRNRQDIPPKNFNENWRGEDKRSPPKATKNEGDWRGDRQKNVEKNWREDMPGDVNSSEKNTFIKNNSMQQDWRRGEAIPQGKNTNLVSSSYEGQSSRGDRDERTLIHSRNSASHTNSFYDRDPNDLRHRLGSNRYESKGQENSSASSQEGSWDGREYFHSSSAKQITQNPSEPTQKSAFHLISNVTGPAIPSSHRDYENDLHLAQNAGYYSNSEPESNYEARRVMREIHQAYQLEGEPHHWNEPKPQPQSPAYPTSYNSRQASHNQQPMNHHMMNNPQALHHESTPPQIDELQSQFAQMYQSSAHDTRTVTAGISNSMSANHGEGSDTEARNRQSQVRVTESKNWNQPCDDLHAVSLHNQSKGGSISERLKRSQEQAILAAQHAFNFATGTNPQPSVYSQAEAMRQLGKFFQAEPSDADLRNEAEMARQTERSARTQHYSGEIESRQNRTHGHMTQSSAQWDDSGRISQPPPNAQRISEYSHHEQSASDYADNSLEGRNVYGVDQTSNQSLTYHNILDSQVPGQMRQSNAQRSSLNQNTQRVSEYSHYDQAPNFADNCLEGRNMYSVDQRSNQSMTPQNIIDAQIPGKPRQPSGQQSALNRISQPPPSAHQHVSEYSYYDQAPSDFADNSIEDRNVYGVDKRSNQSMISHNTMDPQIPGQMRQTSMQRDSSKRISQPPPRAQQHASDYSYYDQAPSDYADNSLEGRNMYSVDQTSNQSTISRNSINAQIPGQIRQPSAHRDSSKRIAMPPPRAQQRPSEYSHYDQPPSDYADNSLEGRNVYSVDQRSNQNLISHNIMEGQMRQPPPQNAQRSDSNRISQPPPSVQQHVSEYSYYDEASSEFADHGLEDRNVYEVDKRSNQSMISHSIMDGQMRQPSLQQIGSKRNSQPPPSAQQHVNEYSHYDQVPSDYPDNNPEGRNVYSVDQRSNQNLISHNIMDGRQRQPPPQNMQRIDSNRISQPPPSAQQHVSEYSYYDQAPSDYADNTLESRNVYNVDKRSNQNTISHNIVDAQVSGPMIQPVAQQSGSNRISQPPLSAQHVSEYSQYEETPSDFAEDGSEFRNVYYVDEMYSNENLSSEPPSQNPMKVNALTDRLKRAQNAALQRGIEVTQQPVQHHGPVATTGDNQRPMGRAIKGCQSQSSGNSPDSKSAESTHFDNWQDSGSKIDGKGSDHCTSKVPPSVEPIPQISPPRSNSAQSYASSNPQSDDTALPVEITLPTCIDLSKPPPNLFPSPAVSPTPEKISEELQANIYSAPPPTIPELNPDSADIENLIAKPYYQYKSPSNQDFRPKLTFALEKRGIERAENRSQSTDDFSLDQIDPSMIKEDGLSQNARSSTKNSKAFQTNKDVVVEKRITAAERVAKLLETPPVLPDHTPSYVLKVLGEEEIRNIKSRTANFSNF